MNIISMVTAMKRILPVLLTLITFGLTGYSQPLHIDWQNCFGGAHDDYGADMLYTGDGILVTGYSEGDTWLFKIDTLGNVLWEKDLNDTVTAGAGRILKSADGHYFIIAQTGSEIKEIVDSPSRGYSNYMIIKMDGSGNILWEHTFGGSSRDDIRDAVATYDGGVVVVGNTLSDDGDVTKYFGSWDSWMIKVDKNGQKVWDFTMGTSGGEWSNGVIETSDHGTLVAITSLIGSGGNIYCDQALENVDVVLFKLDSIGKVEWHHCYGGSDAESASTLIETDDGYLIASSGSSDDGDLTGSGYHYGYDYQYNNTMDVWLARIDYSGNIIWQKCYGGTNNEWPRRIFHSEDGGFVVFSVTSSQNGDVFGNHSQDINNYNVWATAITRNGELLWQQCLGGSDEEIQSAVQISEREYAVVADVSYGPRGDITCVHSDNQDAWLFKVTNTMVGINDHSASGSIFNVYPNPANEYVVFEVIGYEKYQNLVQMQTGPLIISISDMFGRLITEIPVESKKTVWDAREIQSGVYSYGIRNPGILSNGKVIIRIVGQQ